MVPIYIILFYEKENILISARIFVPLFYMQILGLTLLRGEIDRKGVKRRSKKRD